MEKDPWQDELDELVALWTAEYGEPPAGCNLQFIKQMAFYHWQQKEFFKSILSSMKPL